MTKFYNSLQFRLTMSFLIMILLISGFSYSYTYHSAKDAIKECSREQLMQASEMVVSQLTADRISRLLSFKNGDENNDSYREMVNFARKFREKTPDLSNIYVMKKDKDKISFMLDDLPSTAVNSPAAIGEEYPDYDIELLEAFEGRTAASTAFYTDKWGTFLSGYAPVVDMGGRVLMVVGIDMKVTKAVEKQNFIGSLIYFVIGISTLVAVLFIFFFSATIIKDLKSLKHVANRLSQADINVEIPEIKSKNEIRELSEAMKSVMAAITQLKEIAESAEAELARKGGISNG